MTDSCLPIGWFDLVHDMRDALRREYPSVTVTGMTADRGWLTVDVDDGQLGPAHGRDRGERRVVTCDSCEAETCDA